MDTKKYKWSKNLSGKYTIYDVEIFGLVDDSSRGLKITPSDAKKIVSKFYSNKCKSFYPRIFVGHHQTTENRQGVGFLDNVCYVPETQLFVSDLAELLPETLEDIRLRNKYPYRSVEYIHSDHLITGLALCESQSSYFPLPLLVLGEQIKVGTSPSVQAFQRGRDARICLHARELYLHTIKNGTPKQVHAFTTTWNTVEKFQFDAIERGEKWLEGLHG